MLVPTLAAGAILAEWPDRFNATVRPRLAWSRLRSRIDEAAAFWEALGKRERGDLHRDAAAHERAGAALERRWGDLIASEDPREGTSEEERRFAAAVTSKDREADIETHEIEVEIRETQLRAREHTMRVRESAADARDRVADERDREADTREQTADRRERLADEREGTAEVRQIERVERVQQGEEGRSAAARRDQAALEREEAISERDPQYGAAAAKPKG